MDNAYSLPAGEVLAELGVDAAAGLTDERVIDLRLKHGKNGTQRPREADEAAAMCLLTWGQPYRRSLPRRFGS